jgi:hypothetical protein
MKIGGHVKVLGAMNLDRRHLRDKRLGTACFWACFLIRTWGDGSV